MITNTNYLPINSVQYFASLPYGLNDVAVNKELLAEEKIKGKIYYKIRVIFNKEGGGEDYEDVFVYWIDKKSFKLSYLAYSYNEEDGIGMRFREAYNERYIDGIRFVDYYNLKPKKKAVSINKIDSLFELKKLDLLSKIELDSIEVSSIN